MKKHDTYITPPEESVSFKAVKIAVKEADVAMVAPNLTEGPSEEDTEVGEDHPLATRKNSEVSRKVPNRRRRIVVAIKKEKPREPRQKTPCPIT